MKPPLLYLASEASYNAARMTDDFRAMREFFEPTVGHLNQSSLLLRDHLATFNRRGDFGALIVRGGLDWPNAFFLRINEMINHDPSLSYLPRMVITSYTIPLEPENILWLYEELQRNKQLFENIVPANTASS